jgi:A/G-specific adenine glycosylase
MAWNLAELLLPETNVKEFNWALLDLGRTVCTPRPKCRKCTLSAVCDYAKNAGIILQE